jgi:hypothetical protein
MEKRNFTHRTAQKLIAFQQEWFYDSWGLKSTKQNEQTNYFY